MNFTIIPQLFKDVQMQKVFPDGKTFVDCLPKIPEKEIESAYEKDRNKPGFSLRQFILDHYELPVPHSGQFESDRTKPVEENIEALWAVLTRQPDEKKGSLIPLPYPYIVPGGRFGEIYYWDSYFTMLGLHASGKFDMIENMVRNFASLIDTLGYIPNGNRTYYIGRSQPPFFSLMVQLLSETKGKKIIADYLPQLEAEYHFWMKGSETLSVENNRAYHTAKMPGGEILNRYWDENDTPRPESYREDAELAEQSLQPSAQLYRHLRAGAESGWDFSSRWFKDGGNFSSIHTTDIVPVDLNCLIQHLEMTIAEGYALLKDDAALKYSQLAEKRKAAIKKYCWNDDSGFFTDYDLQTGTKTNEVTLAGSSALFFSIATREEAKRMQQVIEEKFLKPGGLVTSLKNTGQQWDAPNGWAPLQWITVKGLEQYGYNTLASAIAKRWIQLCKNVFKRTGKLMEKYNVIDINLEAGGGEYPGQDGFGWTNGVFLALVARYGNQ